MLLTMEDVFKFTSALAAVQPTRTQTRILVIRRGNRVYFLVLINILFLKIAWLNPDSSTIALKQMEPMMRSSAHRVKTVSPQFCWFSD